MAARVTKLCASLLVLGIAGLAGCGTSVEGSPNATTTPNGTSAPTKPAGADAALWNPCDLPDSAISATRLDPSTKKTDIAGVHIDGWKVCSWRSLAKWYTLGILSGTPNLDDVQRRTDYETFTPLTIGTHRAVQYLFVGDTTRDKCAIAVEVPQGSVIFQLQARYGDDKQGEPCAEDRRHVDDLAKYLPNS